MSMSNPYDPQRRESPTMAFEPIQDRLFRKFTPRVATGDQKPIRGNVQILPDGRPGGRPIPRPPGLMQPIAQTPMMAGSPIFVNRSRVSMERTVSAKRYLEKPKITLLQLNKPSALDAANRIRYVPPTGRKPAPPAPWRGGFTRERERNVDYPKDTGVAMKPVSSLGSRWHQTQIPVSSVPSSAVSAKPTR